MEVSPSAYRIVAVTLHRRLAHRAFVLEFGRVVLEGTDKALLANEQARQASLSLEPNQQSGQCYRVGLRYTVSLTGFAKTPSCRQVPL